MIGILGVDDHPEIRGALRKGLAGHGDLHVVGESDRWNLGLGIGPPSPPRVILVGVNVDRVVGVETVAGLDT